MVKFLEDCKTVRRFIIEHPGSTRSEIEQATGIKGCLMFLETRKAIKCIKCQYFANMQWEKQNDFNLPDKNYGKS